MKLYLLVFVLAVAGVLAAGCGQGEKAAGPNTSYETTAEIAEATTEQQTEEEPLLLLDDGEPLLLLDDDEGAGETGAPQADNSRCFVCHVNYMDEDIAVAHARAGIGCAGCHGESDKHIADESWASGGNGTAPDTMFPRPKIVPFCMGCHPREKIDAVQHQPLFANIETMVCTDCHGNHRLHARKCKWK